ncbi:MAG: polyvinylalcohol dehydrogenase, partial [Fuerstiella sp.]
MRNIKVQTLRCCLGLVTGLIFVGNSGLSAADWNQFRGPNRDNLSDETGLLDRWPDGGPERLWTGTGLGKGYATVAVVGDLIYSMGNVDGAEQIIALDRTTGDIVWKTRNGGEY